MSVGGGAAPGSYIHCIASYYTSDLCRQPLKKREEVACGHSVILMYYTKLYMHDFKKDERIGLMQLIWLGIVFLFVVAASLWALV